MQNEAMLKRVSRAVLPPFVWQSLRHIRGNRGVAFEGDYPSWQAALDVAGGYDAPTILERVREAALKVKCGEAIFERDSVCFDHEEYRWSTLACLLRVAAEHEGKLRVLDFGGALGSFYIQHKKHFASLKAVRWAVVEQKHYIECGRAEFQNEVLQFYESVDECLADGAVDIIFCSSVLEYLETPYNILATFADSGVPYILLDRTPFIEGEQDRLTVQHVPSSVYAASYPAWFFSGLKFDRALQKLGLDRLVEFDGEDDVGIGQFKGVLLAHH